MARRGQNEGSIFERKDGRWAAQVNLGWQDWKRVRKLFYGVTRKEVQEQLTTALSDIQKGLPIVMEKQTVRDYLVWWLENIAKPTVRPSTFSSYEDLVLLHLGPALMRVPLSKLNPQHVRTMLKEKLDAGLSTRRIQYLHAVLRAALNAALKDQLVARNVAALVKPPRVIEKEVRPLTPDEARRFLDVIKGDRLEALFTIAVSLGLRQGEALGLRWSDVDFEEGTLRVRYSLQRIKADRIRQPKAGAVSVKRDTDSKSRELSAFHLVEPKTKQSRRTIALPKVTLSALAAHKAKQSEDYSLAGSSRRIPVLRCDGQPVPVDDMLFVTKAGNPFDAPTVTHRFQALLKRTGIGHHRFHDLRHTAATLLAIQGVHPRAIQAALGWENLSMLNRYTHFVEEQRQSVALAMDAALSPVAVSVAVNRVERKPH